MGSDANGELRVLVWSDDGEVKPVVNDDGRIELTIGESTITLDINIVGSDVDVPVSIEAATIDVPVSIDASTITVPVEEQSPLTSINAYNYGWTGAKWAKLSTLWGFTTILHDKATQVATGAGVVTVSLADITTGYVFIYTGIGVYHDTGVNRDIQVGVYDDTDYYWVDNFVDVPSSRWAGHQCNIMIGAGNNLVATTTAVAKGDTIGLHVTGYRVRVGAT